MLTINAPARWYRVLGDVSSSIFGVDSIFYVGAGHFLNTSAPPFIDTSFAFSFAESIGGDVPSVHFDPYRYPFTSDLPIYWPSGTPPSVAAFCANDRATVTHRYRSFYPASSVVEGEPVGIKTEWSHTDTYLFGFHLWYMKPKEARDLIDWIGDGGTVPCCVGMTGNVDGSWDQTPDIADLTALIWYLYVSMEPLLCPEEANIDGDPFGIVDIGDLTALIDYLFLTQTPTAACP